MTASDNHTGPEPEEAFEEEIIELTQMVPSSPDHEESIIDLEEPVIDLTDPVTEEVDADDRLVDDIDFSDPWGEDKGSTEPFSDEDEKETVDSTVPQQSECMSALADLIKSHYGSQMDGMIREAIERVVEERIDRFKQHLISALNPK